ncbi:MAG: elongation factor G, partial [Lachnospiraceae bacterium]
KGGVEPQSENVWRQADTYNVPRMAFINKMDILGANFYGAVEQIRTRLGKNAIVLQLPIGKEDDFQGIIDLFEMKAYIYNDDKGNDITICDIPEDMKEQAEEYHTELIEKICELDDDLMMQYLEGEEIAVADLKAALRKGCCNCTAIPVCCGSAYRNKGVQKLLDAIIEYMPAPTDIPSIKGVDMDGNEVVRHSSDEEPFAALAFKIMADPFVGKLAYFRVYSGTLNSGSYVYNATKDKKERVGRILQMHANKRMELDKVYSGDIAAAVGFKITTTGDTICDEQHPVILESMEFPEPVIELAIEPKTKAGQQKMGEALAKLAEEDPTFRQHTDQETGQTIIAGMGELHLEIIVDRLLREFKVEANVGAPQVAYKEAITKAVDVDSKYAKQSGGRGQYGHCKVHFTPMDYNGEELFQFKSSVVGGAIPKEYIPAVGEGIEEAMKAGILGGFPVVGVHANVYDGSYHEVDSSEMAFHIAGSLAFKDAMQKASPILLEPIMRVEVTTPEDYMGDVIGDINSRRGRIEGMDDIGGGKMIRGFVPLSEMFGYATDLRSRTQGRGNYSMFFEKYEPVPKSVQEKVLSSKAK